MSQKDPAYKTSVDLRREILWRLEAEFGTGLRVDERMLQTLEYTDDPTSEFPASSPALLEAVIQCQPSVASAIEATGVSLSSLSLPNIYLVKPSEIDWFSFEQILFRWSDGRSPSADRVIRSKRLTVVDAISMCLENKDLLLLPGETITEVFGAEANDLVHFFASEIRAINRTSRSYNMAKLEKYWSDLRQRLQTIETADSSVGQQQLLLYHDGNKYRLSPFGMWGTYQLQEAPLPDGSLWVARTNVLQPVSRFAITGIEELQHLINTKAPEKAFQQFFESHSEFLLALGDYVSLHPQLILHEEGGTRLIPDFFLEKLNSDFCDICDLKKPTADLVRLQRNRIRFRDALREGIAQLETYRDWFESERNRHQFQTRYGLRAYRPQVVIIIGRRSSYYDDVDRIKLDSQLPNWVTLRTYDDVVEKARHWRRLLTGP